MALTGPTTDHDEIRGWAEQHHISPVELLPFIVDHVPAALRLVASRKLEGRKDLLPITWDDFFARFDALGLTFVYDNECAGNHELLQVEGKSPYRNSQYQLTPAEN